MCPDFIYEICYRIPPEQRATKYSSISGYIMIVAELRQEEVKPGKKADYKEQNKRIGECKQESTTKNLSNMYLANRTVSTVRGQDSA